MSADRSDPPQPAGAPPTRRPAIDAARCTGCGRCVAACAPHLISLEVLRWDKRAVLHDAPRCTGCAECAVRCPFRAITMRRADAAGGRGAGG